MKLLRYGPHGEEKPGMLDRSGAIRSLHSLIRDLTPEHLSPAAMDALRAIDPEKLPKVMPDVRIGVPVSGIGQLVCVGLNYVEHAKEANLPIPQEPIVFNKAITSLSGPNDDIAIPNDKASATDWEVELALVIGKRAFQVSQADALSYVAGYCLGNDVSERDYQALRGGQFVKGKSLPTYGKLGPWLVTPDELTDPQKVDLKLSVGDMVCQNGSTADMIFNVAWLISHLTEFMEFQPGDVIWTGTPAGVGYGMNPRKYLQPGEVVTVESSILGRQTQHVGLIK